MLRARFMRYWHLLFGYADLFKGRQVHQAIDCYSGLRTTQVRCTCGREWR